MRIGIREQLGLLNLLTTLIALAVVAIATWLASYRFIISVRSSGLSLTASLFAQQMTSTLETMQSSVQAVSTRVLVQSALRRYNNGNTTMDNWDETQADLLAAIGSVRGFELLLQAKIFGRDTPGPGLVNVTEQVMDSIPLPETYANGSQVMLGDPDRGYPGGLYPNLTYATQNVNTTYSRTTAFHDGRAITPQSLLFLGPLMLNASFALVSITTPIINNTDPNDLLGYLTFVLNAQSILRMTQATQGLGYSGQLLIIAPDTTDQRLPIAAAQGPNRSVDRRDIEHISARFVFPPVQNKSRSDRHPSRAYGTDEPTFVMNQYPAVIAAFTAGTSLFSDDNSLISTTNEEGKQVSVGYSTTLSPLIDWAVIVEESHAEVWEPVHHFRDLLLACVFGTAGVIGLFILPIAHFSVRPIRRLRSATQQTIEPERSSSDDCSFRSFSSRAASDLDTEKQAGFLTRIGSWNPIGRRSRREAARQREAHRKFRIPGKVRDTKHYIHDELTDLTRTFNEMSEELTMQYARLEERVKERTAELEVSKAAAEIANEAKTLFIANISHELKTPLNGILGMCAVSMQENDPSKTKRSLEIIYRSGDLLLHLLTDLLTFTKNQIGQQLTLDQREFRLDDVTTQITSIFDQQAKQGGIQLRAQYVGRLEGNDEEGTGPTGTGKLKQMVLWGDQHRILQVIINLVSNSLKFTPPGGSIDIRIRCLGDAPEKADSMASKPSRHHSAKGSRRTVVSRVVSATSSTMSQAKKARHSETALHINGKEPRSVLTGLTPDVIAAPMPLGTRRLLFEFDVIDTGPGIPPEQQTKVFEPFMQGDLGLSKKYGGTGLGLSICSQLATLMKGDLRLESEEGKGSRFTMEIPLAFVREHSGTTETPALVDNKDLNIPLTTARSEVAQPRLVGLSQPFFATNTTPALDGASAEKPLETVERVTAQAVQSGGKVRVLVAEDNIVNQEVVLRMLKLESIYGKPNACDEAELRADVTVAKDGQEAFELVKESMEQTKYFDLIFMDVQMPNLDGIQSTKLIRGMGYSAPIVALTAFAEESNVKECMDSGMDYFLPKPIRRPALKQVLKRYCAPIPEAAEEHEETKIKANAGVKSQPVVNGSSTTDASPPTHTGDQ